MNKSIPKYILVEDYIKEAIQEKQIKNKLPGERTLAKKLGYSYMTIRKAVDNLVDAGLLYKVPTQGTFVNQTKNKKSHHTIGYFLDSSIQAGLSSPYYSLVFNALEKEANRNNYSLIYFSDANPKKLAKVLSKLDGVIATCLPKVESTILGINQHIPVVVIDNCTADKTIPSVTIDNYNAYIALTNYICSLGHTRIGFMTGLCNSDIGRNRYAGYQHGLKKNLLHIDQKLIYQGDYSYEAGIDGANHFLSLKHYCPSAIICANDSMAIGAIKKFTHAGFNIPNDISIIGFDDIEVASQVMPALTTMAAPVGEIAKQSFTMLNNLLKGEKPSQQHIELMAQLVIRETCAPLKQTAVA